MKRIRGFIVKALISLSLIILPFVFIVNTKADDAVAKVEIDWNGATSEYTSLRDAFKDNTLNRKITLLKDVDVTSNSVYTTSGTITFDLNGHKLTTTEYYSNGILFNSNTTLTVEDSAGGGIITGFQYAFKMPQGSLTIKSGIIQNCGTAVYMPGTSGTASLTINGGTFNACGTIVSADNASVTINGGTFNSSDKIISSSNSSNIIKVNGGTFNTSNSNSSFSAASNEINLYGGTYNFTSTNDQILVSNTEILASGYQANFSETSTVKSNISGGFYIYSSGLSYIGKSFTVEENTAIKKGQIVIPTSEYYNLTVKRNGYELKTGDIVAENETLTCSVSMSSGYGYVSGLSETINISSSSFVTEDEVNKLKISEIVYQDIRVKATLVIPSANANVTVKDKDTNLEISNGAEVIESQNLSIVEQTLTGYKFEATNSPNYSYDICLDASNFTDGKYTITIPNIVECTQHEINGADGKCIHCGFSANVVRVEAEGEADKVYQGLSTAFAENTSGNSTFVLLRDVVLTSPLSVSTSFKLDLNGHKIEASGTAINLTGNTTYEFLDSVGTGLISGATYALNADTPYCDLIIRGGNYTARYAVHTVWANSVTIYDGNFNGALELNCKSNDNMAIIYNANVLLGSGAVTAALECSRGKVIVLGGVFNSNTKDYALYASNISSSVKCNAYILGGEFISAKYALYPKNGTIKISSSSKFYSVDSSGEETEIDTYAGIKHLKFKAMVLVNVPTAVNGSISATINDVSTTVDARANIGDTLKYTINADSGYEYSSGVDSLVYVLKKEDVVLDLENMVQSFAVPTPVFVESYVLKTGNLVINPGNITYSFYDSNDNLLTSSSVVTEGDVLKVNYVISDGYVKLSGIDNNSNYTLAAQDFTITQDGYNVSLDLVTIARTCIKINEYSNGVINVYDGESKLTNDDTIIIGKEYKIEVVPNDKYIVKDGFDISKNVTF